MRKKEKNNQTDYTETIKQKQIKKEWTYIIISAILFILALLYTYTPINISFLNTPLESQEQTELFSNLFTIQATIAALSISIIAIITGFQTERVYGISVTNYITTLKPCLFKHKYLMITDLILTGVNYILVAFELFNMSIAVFVISILISCILIIDTAFVFKSHSEINNEIGLYFKENINLDYLKELETLAYEYAAVDDSARIEDILCFLVELFNDELNKDIYSNDLINNIEKILTNLFISSYLSKNKDMVFSILKGVNNVYEAANNCKNKYPVDIWSNIYIEYLTFISTVSIVQLKHYKKFNIYDFKYNLGLNQQFENVDGKEQEINNYFLEYYYSWMYKYIIQKNKNEFGKDDLIYIKEQLFNASYDETFYEKNDSIKQKNIIGLCYLIKMLIENGEITLLNDRYLRHEGYYLDEISHSYVYLIGIIYSIYLAKKEPLVRGTSEQKNAEDYLKAIRCQRNAKYICYKMNIVGMLEKYFMQFFSLLRTWEKFEDRAAKTIILEPVISNFLFFLCVEKYYNEETLAKCFRLISSNHIESLITAYFNSDELFIEKYKIFYKDLYDKEIQNKHLLSTQRLVRGALEREYKEELIEEAKENYIRPDAIENYKEKINEFIHSELSSYKIFDNNVEEIQTKHVSMDLGHLIDVNDFKRKDIDDWVKEQISYYLYQMLINSFKNSIRMKKISYNSNSKQQTLIELSEGLSPDTFIGCRETFWEEDDKNLLINFTEGMHKIGSQHSRDQLFLLNSSMTHFTITNIRYDIYDCTVDDFENLNVIINDGKYFYSRYCLPLKAPFTKEELFEYLNKTLKHFVITAEINIGVTEEIIGCGIDIVYEDSDTDIDE